MEVSIAQVWLNIFTEICDVVVFGKDFRAERPKKKIKSQFNFMLVLGSGSSCTFYQIMKLVAQQTLFCFLASRLLLQPRDGCMYQMCKLIRERRYDNISIEEN